MEVRDVHVVPLGSAGSVGVYLWDPFWSWRYVCAPMDPPFADLILPSLFAVDCVPNALERDVWWLREDGGCFLHPTNTPLWPASFRVRRVAGQHKVSQTARS